MLQSDETVISEETLKNRPDILYRGFTIHPDDLTVIRITTKPLVQGDSKDNPDPARNENGVYMSTNPSMVRDCYLHGSSDTRLQVPTLQYNLDGLLEQTVQLPSVGIQYEINTKGLDIRPPKITPALQGVYNNGYEGDEWIADSVPYRNYKVKRLVLSRWPNDSEQITIEINNHSELPKAIERIKTEFEKRKQQAYKFRDFLETLEPFQRTSMDILSRTWEKYLSNT